MNIFNKRELFLTMDMEKFNIATSILKKEEINYSYKTINAVGYRSGRVESVGLNSNYMFQYYIYVHKKDYDKARIALRNIK